MVGEPQLEVARFALAGDPAAANAAVEQIGPDGAEAIQRPQRLAKAGERRIDELEPTGRRR